MPSLLEMLQNPAVVEALVGLSSKAPTEPKPAAKKKFRYQELMAMGPEKATAAIGSSKRPTVARRKAKVCDKHKAKGFLACPCGSSAVPSKPVEANIKRANKRKPSAKPRDTERAIVGLFKLVKNLEARLEAVEARV